MLLHNRKLYNPSHTDMEEKLTFYLKSFRKSNFG